MAFFGPKMTEKKKASLSRKAVFVWETRGSHISFLDTLIPPLDTCLSGRATNMKLFFTCGQS